MDTIDSQSQTHSLLPSTGSTKKPSARNKQAILRLGLRYRPLDQDKHEAFTAKLALLSTDTADIPPDLLERAADEIARSSRFLPAASELWERARSYVQQSPGVRIDLAERYNARLKGEGRRDIRWIYDHNGDLKLERA